MTTDKPIERKMKPRPCDTQECVNICGEGHCDFLWYISNDGCAFKPVRKPQPAEEKILIEGKMLSLEGKIIPMVPADPELRKVIKSQKRSPGKYRG